MIKIPDGMDDDNFIRRLVQLPGEERKAVLDRMINLGLVAHTADAKMQELWDDLVTRTEGQLDGSDTHGGR